MNWRALAAVAAAAVASAPAVAQQETKPAAVEQAAPQQPESRYADKQLVVLYLDLTALPKEDLARVGSAAKKFLDTRSGGNQLVALISYDGRSVRVGQDFTGEFDRLEKTLDQVQASGGSAAEVSDMDRAKALEQAVGMLGTLPQKKALVYFGTPATGSPEQREATIKAAIAANVAFYPIDVRGVVAAPGK
ncbi:MAG: hypothetical protein ABSF62_22520 [Bryobacteraceae bacterium]